MEKKLPSLPATTVSLNAIHDALTKGASPEDAVKAGLGEKPEKTPTQKKAEADSEPAKKSNG